MAVTKIVKELDSKLMEDGTISKSEEQEFFTILDSLDKISQNATALKLWAQKNISIEE